VRALLCVQRLTLLGTAAAGGACVFYGTADAATQFSLISAAGPVLRLFDPETSHNIGIEAAKMGLLPRETRPDPAVLNSRVWNKHFSNPVGAAGQRVRATACCPLLSANCTPTCECETCRRQHMQQLAHPACPCPIVCLAGLAAGFDKHAEVMESMMRMGFGFVEVGEFQRMWQLHHGSAS